MSYEFLWDESASDEDVIGGLQEPGQPRNRMAPRRTRIPNCDADDRGRPDHARRGHRGYYGNYVPSRFEVIPGSVGGEQFVEAQSCWTAHGSAIVASYWQLEGDDALRT